MGETDEHRDEMVRHIELLAHLFQGQQVYVSGDLLLYYEQGNPKKFVVPDAFIVKGVSPGKRRIYKLWVERKPPDLVIETTSRKTRRKDTLEKPELYSRLGIKEYFMFDPDQEYLDPPLQGYRLEGSAYAKIVPDEHGRLFSRELNVHLCIGEGHIQFLLPNSGERLLTGAERSEREAERAQRESERAQRESERAQRESERAQRESERADREAAARQEAEAELARLRAELARRTSPKDRR
jgi:hypothetical protein